MKARIIREHLPYSKCCNAPIVKVKFLERALNYTQRPFQLSVKNLLFAKKGTCQYSVIIQ